MKKFDLEAAKAGKKNYYKRQKTCRVIKSYG